MADSSELPTKPVDSSRKPELPLDPDHPKIKTLALALLLMISVAAGFAGGWAGARNNQTIITPVEKQQVILKGQGELIGQIAKDVGASVVSVETTAVAQSF